MNLVRTGILLATLTALFAVVGLLVGGQSGMVIAFIIAMGMNAFSYWNSDKMVLRMQGAQEVDASSAPEYVALVRQLTTNAGLPMPRTYVMDSPQPNAFATGRNPEHAAICATTGLFQLLSMEEIAGVLGHELAHVKNRDTLTMTVSATLAGAIGMLANFAQFGAIFGGGNRNGDRRLGWIGVLAVSMLAPMAAGIVQMAISRTREYDADRIGAGICRNPLWLASALRKINEYARRIPNDAAQDNPAMAHLYIINPLHGGLRDNLFSTHPDTENRIAALEQLAREMGRMAEPEGQAGGIGAGASFSDARGNPILGDRSGGAGSGDSDDRRGPWGRG